jgi:hypothetical protein
MYDRPADKREKRLRNLTDLLDNYNRRDMRSIMGQLSLEFYRQEALAEGYVYEDNLSGAEGHRLIAEAIHQVLKTLESKRREAVEVEIASTITDIVTNKTEEQPLTRQGTAN